MHLVDTLKDLISSFCPPTVNSIKNRNAVIDYLVMHPINSHFMAIGRRQVVAWGPMKMQVRSRLRLEIGKQHVGASIY